MFIRRLRPLIATYGNLYVTTLIIYFQPIYTISIKPVKKIMIDQINKIYKRRFELKNIGLEIMLEN